MKKNKYHNQKKILLVQVSLYAAIFFIFLNTIVNNNTFAAIFGALGIILMFSFTILSGIFNVVSIIGVPNNSFKEFNISQRIFFEREIHFKETEKGIWECNFRTRRYIVNMKRWRRQTNKILSLLFFFLYVEKYNKGEIKHRGVMRKIKIVNLENCTIVFTKYYGAVKEKNLIKRGVFKKKILIQLKIFCSIPTKGNWLDYEHLFKFKQQKIVDFYDFNEN